MNKRESYTLILSYGEDIDNEGIKVQNDLVTSMFPQDCNLENYDLGWHELAFKVRNKAKKWVKRAKLLKFNFLDDGVFIVDIPQRLKNMEIEPLRFLILKIQPELDLNKILN